jgi:hypothetical protein
MARVSYKAIGGELPVAVKPKLVFSGIGGKIRSYFMLQKYQETVNELFVHEGMIPATSAAVGDDSQDWGA